MRDVSHQCIAAEYLGLHEQNRNMMHLFVKNISESKDWCSYWEINRYNKPAPEDYRNDKEFWYNLPANFDVIQACYHLYLISGDKTYIEDPVFLNFYEKSVNEYIDRWKLNVDQLLTRDAHINEPQPYNPKDPFHYARGIASYIESGGDLRMGYDLVAAIYAGLNSYAAILDLNGKKEEGEKYRKRAVLYQKHLHDKWWDDSKRTYFALYTTENKFKHSEPVTFLLWFNAVSDRERLAYVIEDLAKRQYNVESTSYLPYMFYQHGIKDKAYYFMNALTQKENKRRDYPEVSYGVIHGFVEGLMGVEVDHSENTVGVKSNLTEKTAWAKLDNLEVMSTVLSVKHSGDNSTVVENKGKNSIKLRIGFDDKYNKILINGKVVSIVNDEDDHSVFCIVDCKPGETVTAVAE
jgi:hypothetical protein